MTGGQRSALVARIAEIERYHWLSPDAIAADQLRRMASVAAHFARFSPWFAGRLAKAGLSAADLGDRAGLLRLPVVDRGDLRDAVGLFATHLPAEHAPVADSGTSGSTGRPVSVKRTAVNRIVWLAHTMLDHRWHNRDFSARFCALRASVSERLDMPDWGDPVAMLTESGRALALPLRWPIDRQAEAIRDFAPAYLLGYPSSFGGLLDFVEADGAGLPGLRELRTMGEIVTEEFRQRAGRLLGVGVTDCYSANEVGYVALQCPASGLYHVMADSLIVEVLDPNDDPVAVGGIGRVVVTDLRNLAMTLIRYAIGDHAEVAEPCPCGRGLPTLRRIVGRTRNLLTMPDGSRRWPYLGAIGFRKFGGIRQYQLVQTSDAAITVRLVVDERFDGGREEGLRGKIRNALGAAFAIDFVYLEDRIAAGPTGKYEEFIGLAGGQPRPR